MWNGGAEEQRGTPELAAPASAKMRELIKNTVVCMRADGFVLDFQARLFTDTWNIYDSKSDMDKPSLQSLKP